MTIPASLRYLLRLTLLVGLLSAGSLFLADGAQASDPTGVVTNPGSCITVREAPTGASVGLTCIPHNTSRRLWCYAPGSWVTSGVFDNYSTNTWYRVTYSGEAGFVSGAYVATSNGGPGSGQVECTVAPDAFPGVVELDIPDYCRNHPPRLLNGTTYTEFFAGGFGRYRCYFKAPPYILSQSYLVDIRHACEWQTDGGSYARIVDKKVYCNEA